MNLGKRCRAQNVFFLTALWKLVVKCYIHTVYYYYYYYSNILLTEYLEREDAREGRRKFSRFVIFQS